MGEEKKKQMQPDAGIRGILWNKIRIWRRRAKCKSLIKQVESQVIIRKTRAELRVEYSRSVIADLLKKDQRQEALDEAEQLYRVKRRLAAYDQIMNFCEILANNMSYLCRQSSSEFPRCEVGEAVSSLIFSASNCGEVPQLNLMRNMFKDWFGSRFDSDQVELRKGNLVKLEIKQNLVILSVPDDEKFKLLAQIGEEHDIRIQILGSKRKSNPNHEQISSKDSSNDGNSGTNPGPSVRRSARKSTQGEARPDPISGKTDRPVHVHPKLPDYETVISQVNDSKAKRVKRGDKK